MPIEQSLLWFELPYLHEFIEVSLPLVHSPHDMGCRVTQGSLKILQPSLLNVLWEKLLELTLALPTAV
jgi:hypothetical protein